MTFFQVLIGILCLAVALVYQFRAKRRPGVLYPEPFHWFWGHYDSVKKNGPRMPDFLLELGNKFAGKTYAFSLPGRPHTFRVVTPEAVEHILKTRFDIYVKSILPPTQKGDNIFIELFGDGIFVVDGDKWVTQRKVMSHMFSANVLKNLMEDTFRSKSAVMIEILGKAAEECTKKNPAHTIDMQVLFHRFAMDAMALISFGKDLQTLTTPSTEANKFIAAYEKINELVYQRLLLPKFLMILFRDYKLSKLEKTIAGLVQVVDTFLFDIVKQRKQEISALRSAESKEKEKEKAASGGSAGTAGGEVAPFFATGKFRGDLLTSFIKHAEETGMAAPTDQMLRDVAFIALLAGRDTTASLLTWAFYEMSQHPVEMAKVQDEIDRAYPPPPTTGAGTGPTCEPKGEDMQHLPYLHAFFMETLRLHPAVPHDTKVCAADDKLPDGTPVQRGDFVSYPLYALGRFKHIWGEDAEQFKPERFLDEKEPSPYKFSFFNAGPRLCVGKRAAFLEVMIAAVMLLTKFKFTCKKDHNPAYKATITLTMRHGLPMHVALRDTK